MSEHEVKLKICGLTREEDVRTAISVGADYLGFIFHPGSPRYVVPDRVEKLLRLVPPAVGRVGVFVNLPPETVMMIMERYGLDIAQLHGDESPETASAIGAERVWKAMTLCCPGDVERAAKFPAAAIVADSRTADAYGGTGRIADWQLAARAARCVKLILAGGLSPANVADAIRQVVPFAVDVNSGVESAPGVKDPELLFSIRSQLHDFA